MGPRPVTDEADFDFVQLNYELGIVKTAAFTNSSSAFLGPLMCGMDFVWTFDVETAATDGVRIFWNPKDFQELDLEMRKSTLLHELWHPAKLHFLRQGDRDGNDWNIACDIDINNDLKADGYKIEQPFFIYDPKYRGWAVEAIYNDIHKEDQCAPWGSGQDPGDGAPGSKQQLPGKGGTSGKDMVTNLSPADTQRAINNVVQAIHAADAAKKPGDVPGSVREIVKKFLAPRVPWDIVLDRFLEEKCSDDYTYRRPNRRFSDVYMPSLDSDGRLSHLIFYEDVSGSVGPKESIRINSEIKHIKDKFNPELLTIVQFDTRITKEITFTENDPFEEIELIGRGGTCLKEVREHMMKHRPTAAVVLSDLYVDPMEPGPDCPVLWIAIENRGAKVNFGQLIHIKA